MDAAPEESKFNSAKQAERQWHDAHYKSHADSVHPPALEDFRRLYVQGQLAPFCEGGRSWWGDARREALDVVGEVRGLSVLDYGCGFGSLGLYLSHCGAEVWGFDFSGAAVETANEAARRFGLSAQFAQMDAEHLTYESDFFDLVIGFGVLHHVIKYPGARSQLYRVLKPGGRAVFHETLWDNPLINLARRFTTAHADAGDAALTERELRKFCQGFSRVQLEKRHLLYMLKRLAKLPPPDWAAQLRPRLFWKLVKSLDNQILRIRPLRRYCGEVLVFLQK